MAVDGHGITDGDNNFLNLLGQLACRCKNQCLACLEVGIKFLEDRGRWKVQKESEGERVVASIPSSKVMKKKKSSVILRMDIDRV